MQDKLTDTERKQLAGELSNALAASAPVEKKRSLFDLTQAIETLGDTEGSVPDELLAEFRAEVQATLSAKGEKVDSYAKLIHYHMKRAGAAKGELVVEQESEVDRLKKRIKREEGTAERLGNMALWVISQMPRDAKGKYAALEGEKYTLQAAAVADSCEVTDESLVPIEFKDVTISLELPAKDWSTLATEPKVHFKKDLFKTEYSIDKKRLLAALKEECQSCEGRGKYDISAVTFDEPAAEPPEEKICPKCNGSGRLLVPGAKLLTGKMRLVVK